MSVQLSRPRTGFSRPRLRPRRLCAEAETIKIWPSASRPRHGSASTPLSKLSIAHCRIAPVMHGAIPIALAASDFPFRLLLDAVTHVLSVFRVCKVP